MQIPQEKKTDSEIKTLFVFNPEHDLALAVGSGPYTPPAEILKLKRKMSLLPAVFAANGDFIFSYSPISEIELEASPYYPLFKEKNLKLLTKESLISHLDTINKIKPWGWDHAVVRDLKECGIANQLLPSESQLNCIRNLSHRRTTIPFRKTLSEILNEEIINPAKELFSLEEVKDFLNLNPVSFFKSPWSSSGRGIVLSTHIALKGLLEWAHGTIKKQGSVIAEPAWERVMDFATEWEIIEKEPVFKGYSIFKTSSRGKYHGNVCYPQTELLNLIRKASPKFSLEIIEAQKIALETHISPYYEGPLGIDMLADKNGNINNCVELNLRYTMGHIFLYGNSKK